MIFEHSDYRAFLKSALGEKIVRNPAYSLRSMARDLEMSPALLSQVTRGAKNLSDQSALRVARRLRLTARESDYFCTLVRLERARSPEMRETLVEKLALLSHRRQRKTLDAEAFQAIAGWYHLPILQMASLDGFKFAPTQIGERLGISALEAKLAVDRLVRLKLLEKIAEGKYRRLHKNVVARSDRANLALRQFHCQMFQRAAQELERGDVAKRCVGSETFAIDVSQLAEAREIVEAFFGQIVSYFDRGKRHSEVYHLGVQLFPVTRTQKDRIS